MEARTSMLISGFRKHQTTMPSTRTKSQEWPPLLLLLVLLLPPPLLLFTSLLAVLLVSNGAPALLPPSPAPLCVGAPPALPEPRTRWPPRAFVPPLSTAGADVVTDGDACTGDDDGGGDAALLAA